MVEEICDALQAEQKKAIPFMLKGDALALLEHTANDFETYSEELKVLRKWYTVKETRSLK